MVRQFECRSLINNSDGTLIFMKLNVPGFYTHIDTIVLDLISSDTFIHLQGYNLFGISVEGAKLYGDIGQDRYYVRGLDLCSGFKLKVIGVDLL